MELRYLGKFVHMLKCKWKEENSVKPGRREREAALIGISGLNTIRK